CALPANQHVDLAVSGADLEGQEVYAVRGNARRMQAETKPGDEAGEYEYQQSTTHCESFRSRTNAGGSRHRLSCSQDQGQMCLCRRQEGFAALACCHGGADLCCGRSRYPGKLRQRHWSSVRLSSGV